MATPFPITLPAGSVLGRLALTAGDAESIPLAQLLAAMTGGTSYIGQIIAKRKTADQSQTTNTVLANDNALAFSIAANEEWIASFFISAGDTLSTTGIRVGIATPSGATQGIDMVLFRTTSAIPQRSTSSGVAVINDGPAAATEGQVIANLWVLNGGTAGSVTLQWAQQTSSATALIIRKGSFMHATRVA